MVLISSSAHEDSVGAVTSSLVRWQSGGRSTRHDPVRLGQYL